MNIMTGKFNDKNYTDKWSFDRYLVSEDSPESETVVLCVRTSKSQEEGVFDVAWLDPVKSSEAQKTIPENLEYVQKKTGLNINNYQNSDDGYELQDLSLNQVNEMKGVSLAWAKVKTIDAELRTFTSKLNSDCGDNHDLTNTNIPA